MRAALVLAALPIVIAIIGIDARMRRANRDKDKPAIAAVAKRLPSGDLALSGGARWLRTPSLEEPGAAFADGIAVPDPVLFVGVRAPPREAWSSQ